ncbi:ferrous iron transport protein B [Martelella lutilitoris]|uniref:Ferrous iron transport protein B n=1 Tax=Martelella lutilitoris TaxID=2583532 RepID=A0A7T7KL23_9HYPH|nr:ferrous iron transport protein B [Martelella lutilitoris]QQM30245.1 ferrous iron transport protein B [Martelella lutilitoris]
MSHCSPAEANLDLNDVPRIAMIGQPNTGKSMLYNRITGASAYVGNWPGITVSLSNARVKLGGKTLEFVDLPGIYDLEGFSEDETVVADFLKTYPVDLVIIVINASQIDRQILMPLQVKQLGLPAVVMLNMADEARKNGIEIDTEALSARLGLPVQLISAKYGEGYPRAIESVSAMLEARAGQPPVLADYETLRSTLMTEETLAETLSGAVVYPEAPPQTITQKLDRFLLHPVFGLPLFFAVMLFVFYIVWSIGLPSQDWVGFITDWIQNHILEPVLSLGPGWLRNFVINGIWLGVATVASFVPLIMLFFFCMAAVEDSGYLSRAAYLMDTWMRRIGLDGRSFVMQMMGFGCNVPALMGTRVMRSQPLRLLSMLIIPFSLCSARLAVFVFIIAAVFPPAQGPIVLFSFYVISFAAAFLAAAIFSRSKQFRNTEPFVLELPPYRVPTLRQVWLRGYGELREFLHRATNFIIIGTVAVWFLTNFPTDATGLDTWGGKLGELLQPVMAPIGINPYLTLALIFGFIAKEVVIGSLSTIYAMSSGLVAHQIAISVSPAAAYSFCLFCLLYTPCLTTVATVKAESRSWGFMIFSLIFSLLYAWVIAFLFYQGALLLGFE